MINIRNKIFESLRNRLYPTNPIIKRYIKQIGYIFYLKRSIFFLYKKFTNKNIKYLPKYISSDQPKYLIKDWDPSSSEIFITDGLADWGLEVIFFHMVDNGGCFIDIGAHTGYFSHLLYSKCSHFVNIEISERCTKECLDPIKRSWKEKIVHNENRPAFSFSGKEVEIIQEDFGWGYINDYAPQQRKENFKILETISCDDLMESLFLKNNFKNIKVNAIKIDVDGPDMEILSGCRKIIAKYRPILFCESIDYTIIQLSEKNKYTVFTFVNDDKKPNIMEFVKIKEIDDYKNKKIKMSLAVPNERAYFLEKLCGLKRNNHNKKNLFINF